MKRTKRLASAFPIALGLVTILAAIPSCGKPAPQGSADSGGADAPASPDAPSGTPGAPAAPGTTGSTPGNPYPGFNGGEFHGDKNFAYLINNFAKGKASPTPWAGYWWPYGENGIASGKYGGGLSPAGKYDAARGGQTHAQEWEIRNHGLLTPHLQGWYGHCNGWTAASSLFPEPREPVHVNGIQFDVADIKALLTEGTMEASADFYGERVDYAQDYDSPKYYDTVPDQYFMVLTNYMGKLKQAVLIDRYTGDQIWNQPLAGYTIDYPKPEDYLGADPQAPNVYRILVTSRIWWQSDEVTPDVQTPHFDYGDDTDITQSRTLKMEVWLDAPVVFGSDGKIQSSGDLITTRNGRFVVGGAWRMGEGYLVDAWPDYMWVAYSAMKPTDYANPEIDMDWIKKHILVPGGADDPSSGHHTPEPVPSATPSHSSTPDPWPTPTITPTHTPDPWPTHDPNPWPTPTPTHSGGGWPWPWPWPTHRR